VTPNEYLSTAQAARLLGVSDETLRRWAEERKIRHTRLPSGRLRFTLEDINASLEVVEPEVQAS
jgi:excisionase family DNA binding protein